MKKNKILLISLLAIGALVGCSNKPSTPSNSSSEKPSSSEVVSSSEQKSEISSIESSASSEEAEAPLAANELKLDVAKDLEIGEIVTDVTTTSNFKLYGRNDGEDKKVMSVEETEDKLVIDADTTIDFTKRIKTNGASSNTAGKEARMIEFATHGQGTVEVVAKSGSATDLGRNISLVNVEKGAEHDKVTLDAKDEENNSVVGKYTLTYHYSGTYRLVFPQSIYVYSVYVNWDANGVEDTTWAPALKLKDDNKLDASELPGSTLTETLEVGNFKIAANETEKVVIDANSKTYDGVKYTNRIKLGGATEGHICCADFRSIHFTTTGAARVTVVCMSSSSSKDSAGEVRKLVADGEDTVVEKFETIGGTINGYLVTIEEAGEYYFVPTASQGTNVYGIIIEY